MESKSDILVKKRMDNLVGLDWHGGKLLIGVRGVLQNVVGLWHVSIVRDGRRPRVRGRVRPSETCNLLETSGVRLKLVSVDTVQVDFIRMSLSF